MRQLGQELRRQQLERDAGIAFLPPRGDLAPGLLGRRELAKEMATWRRFSAAVEAVLIAVA